MLLDFTDLKCGDEIPPRTFGPITRTTLALYAGGSGDHNPIHIDSDFAKRAGMADVFAHGMLSMAYMAQYIEAIAPSDRLRSCSVRFTAIMPVNALVICSAKVVAVDERNDISLALEARTDRGLKTLAGRALIAM